MNLSSLLNNRAFLVDSTFRDDSVLNKEFLQRCLRDSKIDDTILDVSIVSEENNYDSYEIQTSEGRFFRLKISEDPDSQDLKREHNILKITQGVATGKLFSFKESKTPLLIFQFPDSISSAELARSELVEDCNNLFRGYFALHKAISPAPKRYYKSIIKDDAKKLSLENFPEESQNSIKDYSNYTLLNEFLTDLAREIEDRASKIPATKTCLGGMPLKNIFYSNGLYFFDYLHKTSLCHPFIDLADFILDFGADDNLENLFLEEFCQVGNLDRERNLYKEIYELQLRQRLLDAVTQYLLEVYVLRSQRVANLVNLAGFFSHSFDRFKSIPLFVGNHGFLLKTLTEPVLGVKA